MPESKELHQKVDEILMHTKSMDGQLTWIIKTQAEGLKKILLGYFSKRKRAARVFLAINGSRSSGEIARHLDIRVQNVSNEIKDLLNKGLVDQVRYGVYRKNKIEIILGLSTELRKDREIADI